MARDLSDPSIDRHFNVSILSKNSFKNLKLRFSCYFSRWWFFLVSCASLSSSNRSAKNTKCQRLHQCKKRKPNKNLPFMPSFALFLQMFKNCPSNQPSIQLLIMVWTFQFWTIIDVLPFSSGRYSITLIKLQGCWANLYDGNFQKVVRISPTI